MRAIPDRTIGERTAQLLIDRYGTLPEVNKQIGINTLEYKRYTDGMSPSARTLQRLAYSGFDVYYILTGERK